MPSNPTMSNPFKSTDEKVVALLWDLKVTGITVSERIAEELRKTGRYSLELFDGTVEIKVKKI